MHRMTLISGSLALLGLLLANCAPAATSAPPSPRGAAVPATESPVTSAAAPAATPKLPTEALRAGGVLTRSTWADPPTMDLHQEISLSALAPFGPAYNGLIQFDPLQHEKIVPALAERWEVNQAGDVYTFHLRKDVKWHDGKPFTAEDAAFSLMRLSHPKDFGTVSPRGAALVGAIKKAEATGDLTVRVELAYPQASFLEYAANDWIKMMPKHTILANQGNMKRVVNGTGPFRLKDFNRGVVVHLVRNGDYFVPGRPYLEEYKIYPIPDDTTRFAALRTGRVLSTMLSARSIAPEQADWAKQNMADKITVGTHLSTAQWNLELNHARAPWSDIRVRKAVNLAISRQNLYQVSKGYADYGDVHYADGPWGIPQKELLAKPGWREPKDPDIAEAKKLLAEAGFSQGVRTTLLIKEGTIYADMAQAVQRDLAQIGIDATIEQRMQTDADERASKGNFDLILTLWVHMMDDPATIYRGIYLSEKTRLKNGFNDKQIDAWFLEQETMLDKEKRRELVRKMADRITSEVASVNLVWQGYIYAHWKEVRDFVPGPGIFHNNLMQDVWLAK